MEQPNGRRVEYLVDGRDRRVGKRVDGELEWGLLYRGALAPVAELDGDGGVVSRFIYGERSHVPSYMLRDGEVYRIVSDHLGSPRVVVNAETGEVAQRLDYDAFGVVTRDTNPGFQPFGFAGGLYDPDTGLVRLGARDYDPRTGRWTAKDPILFQGGDTNLYGYVVNDPVNKLDILGLEGAGAQALRRSIGAMGRGDSAITYSRLAERLGSTTMAMGNHDYQMWKKTGLHAPDMRGSLIPWNEVDWGKYDQGTFEETIREILRNSDSCPR